MNNIELRMLRALVATLRGLCDEIHAIAERQKATETDQHDHPVKPLPIEVRSSPEPHIAIREYYEAENREHKSFWWKLKPWLEGVGVIVAFALAILTFKTLRQVTRQADNAQTQVSIMQKQLEATDRPWIQVQVGSAAKPEAISISGANPDTPLTIDQNGQGSLIFSRSLTNVGKSVANRVDFVYRMVTAANSYSSQVLEEQKRLCSKPTQPVQNAALFPNQPDSGNAFGTFQTQQIPAPSAKSNSKTVYLFIIGCVNYDYPSSATTHQTGFVYEVFPGEIRAEIHQLITIPMVGPPVRQLSFELQEMYAK